MGHLDELDDFSWVIWVLQIVSKISRTLKCVFYAVEQKKLNHWLFPELIIYLMFQQSPLVIPVLSLAEPSS